MKRFLVCVAWWLVLSSAATQAPYGEVEPEIAPLDLCQGKNPLLEHFSILGVQIYKTPQPADDVCVREWNEHGTCCNAEQAANVTDTRIAQFASSLNDMLSQVESMEQSMQRFLDLPLKSVILKVPLQLKPIEFPIKLKSGMSLQEIKLTVLRLKAWIQRKSEKLVPEQQKCVDILKKITLASTCSICSGRSSVFFAGKQLKMAAHTCRAIVKECSHAWLDLVEMVDAIKAYSGVAQQLTTRLKLSDPKSAGRATLNGVSELANEIKLEKILKLCGRNLNSCRYSHISVLCENFVYVVHPSYIEQAKSTINNITKVVDVSKGELDQIAHLLDTENKKAAKMANGANSVGMKGILAQLAGLEKIETNLITLQSNIRKIQQQNLKVRFSNLVAFQRMIATYTQHTKRALENINKNLLKVYQRQHGLIMQALGLEVSEEAFEKFLPKLKQKEANLLKKFDPATNKLKSAQQVTNWAIGNSTKYQKSAISPKQMSAMVANVNRQVSSAIKALKTNRKSNLTPSPQRPRLLVWSAASYRSQFVPRVDHKRTDGVKNEPGQDGSRSNSSTTVVYQVRPPVVQHREALVPRKPVESPLQVPVQTPTSPGTTLLAATSTAPTSDFSVIKDALCQDNCVSLSLQDSGP